MAALARPRFDYSRHMMFGGKIGIWPFAQIVNTKRPSKNQSKGHTELKPILSIRKNEVRDMIMNNIIPFIANKWSTKFGDNGTRQQVIIQSDNALPHLKVDDGDFVAAAASVLHLDIKMVAQPALSPDLNVCDLGFFDSLQSIHDTNFCLTYDKLFRSVQSAFHEFKDGSINDLWLTLQAIYNEIIKEKGVNKYRMPDINIQRLMKQGRLSSNMTICSDAMTIMKEYKE